MAVFFYKHTQGKAKDLSSSWAVGMYPRAAASMRGVAPILLAASGYAPCRSNARTASTSPTDFGEIEGEEGKTVEYTVC